MDTKYVKIGGAALVSALVLIAAGWTLAPDATHACEDLKITMKCDRLSTTGGTCYPNPVVRTGSKYCASGWVEMFYEEESVQPVFDSDIITCTSKGCSQ